MIIQGLIEDDVTFADFEKAITGPHNLGEVEDVMKRLRRLAAGGTKTESPFARIEVILLPRNLTGFEKLEKELIEVKLQRDSALAELLQLKEQLKTS